MTADLVRSQGGYTVSLSFLPALEVPLSALVAVRIGSTLVGDTLVPAARGLDVYRHAALFVPAYADALTVKGCPDA